MKLLVTGAAGFIGANYVYYELNTSDTVQVIGLDALTYADNPENLLEAKSSGRFSFIQADITDKERMRQILAVERPDCVGILLQSRTLIDRSRTPQHSSQPMY